MATNVGGLSCDLVLGDLFGQLFLPGKTRSSRRDPLRRRVGCLLFRVVRSAGMAMSGEVWRRSWHHSPARLYLADMGADHTGLGHLDQPIERRTHPQNARPTAANQRRRASSQPAMTERRTGEVHTGGASVN